MSAWSVLEFDQADRMRRALRISNTSVQEMATELDVDRNTVSRYINGHTRPSKATLRIWSMRTGAPLQWLETGVFPGGVTGNGSGTDRYLRSDRIRARLTPPLEPLPGEPAETSAAPAAAVTETRDRDVVVPMSAARRRLGFMGESRSAAARGRGPALVLRPRFRRTEESA